MVPADSGRRDGQPGLLMARTRVKISETGPGFSVLAAELLGAETRVGVQGDEAEKAHPTRGDWTVGELAARHEMGLGVPERSFLRSYFDSHEAQMKQDLTNEYAAIAAGRSTRKKSMEKLGYKWTQGVRLGITSGSVRPSLAASTIKRKGHGTPLFESAVLVNAITHKLYLRNINGVTDPAQRELLRKKPKR